MTADGIESETLTVSDDVAIGGTLRVAGAVDILSALSAISVATAAAVTVGTTLDVTGTTTAAQINFTGDLDGSATSDLYVRHGNIEGNLVHTGTSVGFFNTSPITKRTVTGTVTAGTLVQLQTAFHSLVDQLEAYGLLTDSTT